MNIQEEAILYKDAHVLVVNKPAGLACQGGSGIRSHLLNLLKDDQGRQPHLLHRLDRETSGIIVLAHAGLPANELRGLYTTVDRARKVYTLIVHGRFHRRQFVHKTIHRIRKNGREKMQDSETQYTVVKAFAKYSLLQATLVTGRQHQLRKDMAELEHPILGDDKYGDFSLNRTLREQGLRSLCLSATSIRFPKERTNHASLHRSLKGRIFSIPINEAMQKFLKLYQIKI